MQKIVAAILAHKKPAVTSVDAELRDGSIERVALSSGRYKAKEAAQSLAALGDVVAVRLLSKDGTILQVMRLAPAEAPAPAPAPSSSLLTLEERHLRLVGEIYREASDRAQAQSREAMESALREREMAWSGMEKAMGVLVQVVERASATLADLHDRERETAAKEVELATRVAEAEGGEGAAALVKELPALMPVMLQLVQAGRAALGSGGAA